MSHPAIYIAPQGTTSRVRPPAVKDSFTAAARGPRSHGAVFQDSHTPYEFRNSEFGIRNSRIENREIRNHGAVE